MERKLAAFLLLGLSMTLYLAVNGQRTAHRFKLLTSQRVRSVMKCHEIDSLFEHDFPNILKPRVPGTASHEEVKEYIISRLNQLNCSRWNITTHEFEDTTPKGVKPFTNIIATLDPHVGKRLVLAAHYDSKIVNPNGQRKFLGATDSALPVALLLDMALALDRKLQDREHSEYSLQIIFFDGEEAFVRWTSSDSIYGARRLAQDMAEDGGFLSVEEKSGLEAMEAFILLDLIGSSNPHPVFHDQHQVTTNIFQRIVKIEERLHDAGHLENHLQNYFKKRVAYGWYNIQDDHVPFMSRGVPIVHLITYPFPHVWHTLSDDDSAIDRTMVANFKKIMTIFLHEYFHLS